MDWLYNFPFEFPINFRAIDDAVRAFSVKHDAFFSGITSGLRGFVNTIESILDFIPWFVLLVLVFLVAWRLLGQISKGLLYSGLLFLVGVVGYWDLMNETLAIIIASVIISLILGFPIGILIILHLLICEAMDHAPYTGYYADHACIRLSNTCSFILWFR